MEEEYADYSSLQYFDILHVAKANAIALLHVIIDNFHLYDFNIATTDELGNSLLHIAVYNNNLRLIRKAIELGANVNLLNDERRTPLHIAAGKGHAEAVEILLRNNAIQNIVDCKGEMPIFRALRKERLKAVESFIANFGNVKLVNANSETLLHLAAEKGLADVARILIKAGVPKDVVSNSGCTPLQIAVEKGFAGVVQVLLKGRVNKRVVDLKKRTILHLSIHYNHTQITRILLNSGGIAINARDKKSCTPLHYAVENNQHEIVELLLNFGADVNAADEDGYTPLHLAAQTCENDALKLLKLLIPSRNTNVRLKTFQGDTILHCASHCGNLQAVKLILKKTTLSHVKNRDHYTPLSLAQQCGCRDVVEYLTKLLLPVGEREGRMVRARSLSTIREEPAKLVKFKDEAKERPSKNVPNTIKLRKSLSMRRL